MGVDEKVEAKIDLAKGEVKERVGDLTDDESLEMEGKKDQVKGNLREGLENTKDAIGDVKDAAKDATK